MPLPYVSFRSGIYLRLSLVILLGHRCCDFPKSCFAPDSTYFSCRLCFFFLYAAKSRRFTLHRHQLTSHVGHFSWSTTVPLLVVLLRFLIHLSFSLATILGVQKLETILKLSSSYLFHTTFLHIAKYLSPLLCTKRRLYFSSIKARVIITNQIFGP